MPSEKCPICHKTVPANAPMGLCPECLLKAAQTLNTQARTAGGEKGGRSFVPPTREELGPHFPQLQIVECIGRGGMGTVFRARQPSLNRLVALKVLAPGIAEEPGFTERFAREARALAQMTHPNIVAIHDYGTAGPYHYLVMEHVDGVNLRSVMNSGGVTPAEALAIVPQICSALQYAHDRGVVHRDIKPENILLNRTGTVKVADFGLAKIAGQEPGAEPMTGERDRLGTPHYMAPEQIERPLEVDHRADIYSLGVVFYQMLTGELPLGRFAAPSRRVQIDVRLDEVVLRALEKEPGLRFQQASAMGSEVETVGSSLKDGPKVPASSEEEGSGGKWTPLRLGIAAGAGLLALIGGWAVARLVQPPLEPRAAMSEEEIAASEGDGTERDDELRKTFQAGLNPSPRAPTPPAPAAQMMVVQPAVQPAPPAPMVQTPPSFRSESPTNIATNPPFGMGQGSLPGEFDAME